VSVRRVRCVRRRPRPLFCCVRHGAPPVTRCVRERPLPHRLGRAPLSLCRHRPSSRPSHDERLRRRRGRLSRRRAARRHGRGRQRYRHGCRRRRCDCGRRQRFGLRRGGGRRRDGPWRQERQRIDVALLLRRRAQTEVDVRLRMIRHAARPDGADDGALCDRSPALDGDRAEVHERRRVTERCLDRDRLAAGRHGSGECHDALSGREHVRPGRRAEVDTAVLPARIRMGTIEREGTKDGPVDGPRPCLRRRREHESAERHDSELPDHEASLLPDWRTARPYQGRAFVVNTGYKVRR
jgi:hypothetical protein